MVGILLCVFWLQQAPTAAWWVIVAPLAAASIFGTSLFQATTGCVAVAVYLALRTIHAMRRRAPVSRSLLLIGAAGCAAGLLMIPQVVGYLIMEHRYPGGLTCHWDRFEYAFFGRLVPPGVLANLLDAPWILIVEIGLPALACLLVRRELWKQAWTDPGVRLLILSGAIGIVTMFVLRSDTTPIDYAFRETVMPANVAAAIMTGAMLRRESVRKLAQSWRWGLIAGGCLLGLPVGAYELPAMSLRTFLQSRYIYDADPAHCASLATGCPRRRWCSAIRTRAWWFRR